MRLNLLQKIFIGIYFSDRKSKATFDRRYSKSLSGLKLLIFFNIISISIAYTAKNKLEISEFMNMSWKGVLIFLVIILITQWLIDYCLKRYLPPKEVAKLIDQLDTTDISISNKASVIYGAITMVALVGSPALVLVYA